MFAKTNWKDVIGANIGQHNTSEEIVWEATHIKVDAELWFKYLWNIRSKLSIMLLEKAKCIHIFFSQILLNTIENTINHTVAI